MIALNIIIPYITYHQHGAGDIQVAGNDMRDQLDATALGHIKALDEGQCHCVGLNIAQHQLGQVLDELVGNHKDQDVSIPASLHDIGHSHLIVERGVERRGLLSDYSRLWIFQEIKH